MANIIETGAYLMLWAGGFIAVHTLTSPFFNQMQDFIGGSGTGNNGLNG